MKNINQSASRIKTTVESSMADWCYVTTYSGSAVDEYYEPVEASSGSTLTKCGVDISGGKKKYKVEGELVEVDVIIRLPLDTTISASAIITVTQQNNEVVNDEYNVLNNIRKGKGQLIVKCRKLVL